MSFDALAERHRRDEELIVKELLSKLRFTKDQERAISQRADHLVERVRETLDQSDLVDTFMRQYELSTHEGVLLMCLAEALLRIPDAQTAQDLLEDKLCQADFEKYFNESPSTIVNLSSRALDVTASLLKAGGEGADQRSWQDRFMGVLARSSEPFIRRGAFQAMRLLSNKFVMGRTIGKALRRASQEEKLGYTHSFDMLGEAAMTAQDARRYFVEYREAIRAIKAVRKKGSLKEAPSISIKLSALHPRYEVAQTQRVLQELTELLRRLALEAKEADIALTIDAEESERLELSLKIFEVLSADIHLAGWNGLGLAVQAYQKRAVAVLEWLEGLAKKHGRRIPVRLVKGAYWDSEIKHCQEQGLSDYPVFTRKAATDLSFLVCAQKLLGNLKAFSPAFATHNAHTIAAILEMAGDTKDFEFQRLHGMGEDLYKDIVGKKGLGHRCRIYAPVGNYRDLLPYLVRRLLENGANNSFVNQISDVSIPLDVLNASPLDVLKGQKSYRHPKIVLPRDLYGPSRPNSKGLDLDQPAVTAPLLHELQQVPHLQATPLIAGQKPFHEEIRPLEKSAPFERELTIGTVQEASQDDMKRALEVALKAEAKWTNSQADQRAQALQKAANLMEERLYDFMKLCIYEGGKTIPDALAEVREAIDFCRYYAVQGLKDFHEPKTLPGPTGERNELRFQGRGTFVCISPWNFPLAIFIGQVAAALMAGNTVIAKPARQTPLVAYRAVQLLLEAGIPEDVLHFVPGGGGLVSQTLLADPRIGGLAFTGSTETAWTINQGLAAKRSPLIPFIAETGGQNVMIVDSSALLEQVVADVVSSAFQSAGQRCSALRVLFIQEDIADRLLEMLKGAMAELSVGDPRLLSTDVGPVIDRSAQKELYQYLESIKNQAKTLHQCALRPSETEQGSFVAPTALEISHFDQLSGEKFGPLLHILRYRAQDLEACLDQINGLGYGLTFGLHSRLDKRAKEIANKVKAGNIYVNRNMIGAVVGSQPFGGRGLSGTGPKAGGPHYLHRFATEQTLSVDTTAQGGNTSLMTLED